MNERAHQLRATLPMLADRTHGQLMELYRDTSAERAHIAARAAHEVYVALLRLSNELERGEAEAA